MSVVPSRNPRMHFFEAVHEGDTRLYLMSLTSEDGGFGIFFGVERAGQVGLTRCRFRASDDLGTRYEMAAMVNFDDGRAAFSPIVIVSREEGERYQRTMERRRQRRWWWLPRLPSKQERRMWREWHRAIEGRGPILATGAGVANFSPALDPAARQLRVEMIAAETRPRDRMASSVGFIVPDPYPGLWVFTIPLSPPMREG